MLSLLSLALFLSLSLFVSFSAFLFFFLSAYISLSRLPVLFLPFSFSFPSLSSCLVFCLLLRLLYSIYACLSFYLSPSLPYYFSPSLPISVWLYLICVVSSYLLQALHLCFLVVCHVSPSTTLCLSVCLSVSLSLSLRYADSLCPALWRRSLEKRSAEENYLNAWLIHNRRPTSTLFPYVVTPVSIVAHSAVVYLCACLCLCLLLYLPASSFVCLCFSIIFSSSFQYLYIASWQFPCLGIVGSSIFGYISTSHIMYLYMFCAWQQFQHHACVSIFRGGEGRGGGTAEEKIARRTREDEDWGTVRWRGRGEESRYKGRGVEERGGEGEVQENGKEWRERGRVWARVDNEEKKNEEGKEHRRSGGGGEGRGGVNLRMNGEQSRAYE